MALSTRRRRYLSGRGHSSSWSASPSWPPSKSLSRMASGMGEPFIADLPFAAGSGFPAQWRPQASAPACSADISITDRSQAAAAGTGAARFPRPAWASRRSRGDLGAGSTRLQLEHLFRKSLAEADSERKPPFTHPIAGPRRWAPKESAFCRCSRRLTASD